jgi:alcohol dehydrogenase
MKTFFDIKQVPETKFGHDYSAILIQEIERIGAKDVLLVVDLEMKQQNLTSGIEQLIQNSFPRSHVHVFGDKILSFESIQKSIGSLRSIPYDLVIGYGGWRCTDLAKILALHVTNDQILEVIRSGATVLLNRGVPVVSIPTTPLNGAEIDTKVIFRYVEKKTLIAFEHPFFAPRLTIIDPKLMTTLPPDLTASTGMDALVHAIEALISMEASPFSEILALQSIALIKENLLDAYKTPENIRARYNIALGSLLSALALNMTGSGAIHALAYPLTALHQITHPQASTLIGLSIIRYNLPVVPSQFLRVARLLGCNVQGNESEASKTIEALETLYKNLELPMHLSSYNISGNQIHELADLALQYKDCLSRNPRIIEHEDILSIYRNSL